MPPPTTKAKYRYQNYLFSKVTNGTTAPYIHLLQYMYDTPFTYTVWKDESRAVDALDFRAKYVEWRHLSELEASELGPAEDKSAPSVLEVLVAMCVRVETRIMRNEEKGDRTAEFFWNIMSCLGIAHLNDNMFDSAEVEAAMQRLLNRTYEYNGVNGPFYIENPREDLRKVDLWYQFMWYLAENYDD